MSGACAGCSASCTAKKLDWTGKAADDGAAGSVAAVGAAPTTDPKSCPFIQRRTRLALSPWANATAAIDTPGWLQACKTLALNAELCVRLVRRAWLTPSIVSSCPPRNWWTRWWFTMGHGSRCRAQTLTTREVESSWNTAQDRWTEARETCRRCIEYLIAFAKTSGDSRIIRDVEKQIAMRQGSE